MLRKNLTTLFILAFANCAASAQPIKIAGTGSAVGAMELLIVEFSKKNPRASFAPVEAVGSNGAIRAATAGALDLAVISRPLGDAERNSGAQGVEYARTPFVLAVNAKVPVNALTREQVAELLAGKIEQWPNGQRARYVMRPANDTDTKIVMGLSPAVASAMNQALKRPGMLVASTDREAAELIEKTPGAVGASTLGAIMSESRTITAVALDGAKPSVQALLSGAYPLHKQLFVVWGKNEPAPMVKNFVEFLATPQAKAVLQRTGHVVPPFSGK
jgi:phosphate transport system substrate-binding protein